MLNAYDKDFNKLDGDWGNQRNPNDFINSLIDFEKNYCESDIFQNKDIEFQFDKISKKDLMKFCELNISLLEKVIAIFAWGGMRHDHFLRLMTGTKFKSLNKIFQNKEGISFSNKNWLLIEEALNKLIINDFSRKFHYLSMKNLSLNYCGPAYFTKILYFLFRKKDCFIMDQWTSKSMNIMLHKEFIKLSGNHVSTINDENIYDQFCNFILFIQEKIASTGRSISADETEDLLFSRGGKFQMSWRTYIKTNYHYL
ncbi:MAG: hypothetical protein O3C38_05970 [Proteobacteria bacterium]|nr:hypothetical protein [Pseudomonadota bacterium]MDA1037037.1 hypothetical protein [Pseudomonadota bacterium]